MKKTNHNFRTTHVALMAFLTGILMLASNAGNAQTVTTDKVDYLPGDMVIVSGKGWQAYETVNLLLTEQELLDPGWTDLTKTVVCNSNGEFSDELYELVNADLGAFFHITATGLTSEHVSTITFNDAGGDYGIDFSAYDPNLYDSYNILNVPVAPIGNGSSPLGLTSHSNTKESLMPQYLALGQIVAYEYFVRVDGSGACSNDKIRIEGEFLTVTTNGGLFGFEKTPVNLFAAFVDSNPTDVNFKDGGATATVTGFGAEMDGDAVVTWVEIEGMDPGDEIIVELWVVLQDEIAMSVGGNVKTRLSSAAAIGTCEPGKINTGNQEVPLLQVGDFYTTDVDISVVKTDNPDLVNPGDEITYTIVVNNAGPSVANDVVLTDIMDPNVTYVPDSWSASSSIPENNVMWQDINLSGQTIQTATENIYMKIGETVTITYRVTVNQGAPATQTGGTGSAGSCDGRTGDLLNFVSVTTISDDIVPGNNSWCEPTGVIPPTAPTCEITPTPVTCFEGTDGSATVQATGGSGEYTFTWYKNSDLETAIGYGPSITGLTAGNYTVIVIDVNTELDSECYTTITEPDEIILTCPNPEELMACSNDAQIKAAFDAWLLGASATQGEQNLTVLNNWDDNYPDKCGDIVTVKFWVDDDCADPDGCDATFTVLADTELPVISTLNESGDLGCNPLEIVAPVFTATDNCNGDIGENIFVTTTGVVQDGCYFSQSWTANVTDDCGNIALPVTITYNWKEDREHPVITTEALSGDLGCNPDIVPPIFTGYDNCTGIFTPVVSTNGPTNEGCFYTQTWTAGYWDFENYENAYVDICMNLAEPVSITYTWKEDTEAPVIFTTAIDNQNLGCNPTITPPVFTAIDNCNGDISTLIVVYDGGIFQNGCYWSQTWTANVTDECGNIALPIQITYAWTVDTELPVISTTAESGDLGCNPNVVAPEFTGLDNCDGVFTPVVTTDDPVPNDGGLKAIAVDCGWSQIWTANYTDACGNEAEPVSITYTWKVDTEVPVISTLAESGDLGCNPLEIVAPVFTALDNCDGDISAAIQVTSAGPTGPDCERTQTWTANVMDECLNAAVPVSITYTWRVDLVAPVISTLAEDTSLGCNPEEIVAPVFTAMDNCDGDISDDIVVTTNGPLQEGCYFNQSWTANVKDECLNEATPVTIYYSWKVDTEVPEISTLAESGDLGCNPTIEAPVFTGWDNCEELFEPVVVSDGPTSEGCDWTQTWTATFTDYCLNPADPVSITYTWKEDLVLPVISTLAESGDLGCNPTVVAPVFTGLDNCDGVFAPVVTTQGPQLTSGDDDCTLYSQTWTANYTDFCLNAAVPVSITYTWKEDLVLPFISTNAISGDLGCNPTVVAPVFTGLDNCDGEFTPVVTTQGPQLTSGEDNCTLYSQTWTANYSDFCLNAAVPVSITYTWKEDLVLPVISTTAVSGDLGCNPTVVAPVFTGLDNCDGVFTPVVTIDGPYNDSDPTKMAIIGCTFTQTWTANYTDDCDNEAVPVSITYTWKVDTEAPVIELAEDEYADGYDFGCQEPDFAPDQPLFTASDNCDGDLTEDIGVTTDGPEQDGCMWSQTWTANVMDECENAATPVSITYTWKVDLVPPEIFTQAIDFDDLGCNPNEIVPPVFTGLDNCDGIFEPIVDTAGPMSDGCEWNQTWTATYIDYCQNEATPVIITYTWKVDTEAPVISTIVESGYLGCNPQVETPVFTGLDNCDGVFEPVVTTQGPQLTSGDDDCTLYSQTWTANYTDFCLNAAVPVSITFTWTLDLVKPIFTIPPIEVCELPDAFTTLAEFLAADGSATDNCGLDEDSFTMLGEETCSDESGRAVFTRVYEIADMCGNKSTCTQTITLNCGEINLTKKAFFGGVEIFDDTWSFAIYEGPNGFNNGTLISAQSIMSGSGLFDGVLLSIDETYTVCEIGVPAGWGTTWQIDTDDDFLPDTYVLPYNPDYNSDPSLTQDLGNRCFDFGANTGYPLLATACDEVIKPLVFEVVNSYPGGDARTPGFWKNWNTCTGGGQQFTAEANGGPDEGWFILDDILNDPGITWGTFTLGGEDCISAQRILDNRDLDGVNRASDPAYNLAKHLLAYQLNQGAGAYICYELAAFETEAVNLLVTINFQGIGYYLNKTNSPTLKKLAARANELAAIFDAYNNNEGCPDDVGGGDPPPQVDVELVCPPATTINASKLTQEQLQQAFDNWANSANCIGDCSGAEITWNPVSPECNSTTTVTFTLTSGETIQTCTSTFTVRKCYLTKSGEIEFISGISDSDVQLEFYPNPFSDMITFEFVAKEDTRARLEIFNLTGQRVALLIDGPVEQGVINQVEFNPKDLVSQILIYRLIVSNTVQSGRIIYQK